MLIVVGPQLFQVCQPWVKPVNTTSPAGAVTAMVGEAVGDGDEVAVGVVSAVAATVVSRAAGGGVNVGNSVGVGTGRVFSSAATSPAVSSGGGVGTTGVGRWRLNALST